MVLLTASGLLRNVLNGPTASACPHPAPEDKIPWSNTPPYQRDQAQFQLIPASLHNFSNRPITSSGKKWGAHCCLGVTKPASHRRFFTLFPHRPCVVLPDNFLLVGVTSNRVFCLSFIQVSVSFVLSSKTS